MKTSKSLANSTTGAKTLLEPLHAREIMSLGWAELMVATFANF